MLSCGGTVDDAICLKCQGEVGVDDVMGRRVSMDVAMGRSKGDGSWEGWSNGTFHGRY